MGCTKTDDLLYRLRFYFLLFNYSGIFPYLVQKNKFAISKASILPVLLIFAGTTAAALHLIAIQRFDDEMPYNMNFVLTICLLVSFPSYIVLMQLSILSWSSQLKSCFKRLLKVYSRYESKKTFNKIRRILVVEILMTFQFALVMNFFFIVTRVLILHTTLLNHTNFILLGLAVCRIVESAVVNVVVTFLMLSKYAVKQMKVEIISVNFTHKFVKRNEENFRRLRKIFRDYQEIYSVLRKLIRRFSFILLFVTLNCLLHLIESYYYIVWRVIKPELLMHETSYLAAFTPLAIGYLLLDAYLCFVCNTACHEVSS